MITPLFEDGRVDLEGLRAFAGHLLDAESVDGLFAVGATGEYMRLSLGERKQIIQALGEVDRNGKPIVVNAGGADAGEMLELAKAAAAAKLDAVAAVVPGSIDSTPEALYTYFSPLGDIGLPLIVYWTPHVKNQKPGLDVVSALMRIPSFAGTKDSSRDMESFAGICAEFGEEISVFQGVEMLHLPSLACGSAGVIGGGLNLYPGLLAELTEAFDRHDLAAAIRLQQEAASNWSLLNARKNFRWICKRIWAERGLISGTFCRESDDVPIGAEDMNRIRAMLRL